MNKLVALVIRAVIRRLHESVRDDVIGAATLAAVLIRPFIWKTNNPGWVALDEGSFVFGLMLLYLWLRAVAEVWKETEAQSRIVHEVVSPLHLPDGTHPHTFTREETPAHFKAILVTMAALFIVMVGIFVLSVHKYAASYMLGSGEQNDGNANLELVLKTPKWNERTNRYEMDADLTSSGSLAAQKVATYPKFWTASSATGDRPTKEQVDRRFKAFEEENKYTQLGYNDVGIRQQAQVALKTEFVSDEDHEAVEHGTKWMYIFVIVKYADKTHNEIWSRACAEYDRGTAETCVGHNEAADLGGGSR